VIVVVIDYVMYLFIVVHCLLFCCLKYGYSIELGGQGDWRVVIRY